ncbi:MAG: hypothetical protein AAGI01_13225 [Myxococcota bacterium]
MEFRCAKCGYIGAAAQVRPTADGIVLICAKCEHANPLDLGASASAGAAEPPAKRQPLKARPKIDEKLLQRMIPEAGDGVRCPKCAHLVAGERYCARCGLDVREGFSYAPGMAPWERPPLGKEGVWEQALLLWDVAAEREDPEALEEFVGLVRECGIQDLGIRKLRFHLTRFPDDAFAVEQLGVLAADVQARVAVAEASASASAQQFTQEVGRVRAVLTVLTLVFWGAMVVFFLGNFLSQCN